MKLELQLEQDEWRRAVKAFAKGTKYEGKSSINSSMASILYKSPHSLIKKTFRQTKSGITASLRKRGDKLIINMAIAWLKSKGREINDQTVGLAAQKIVQARWNTVRYIVAGWVPAAIDFRASRLRPPGARSVAADGYGKPATEQNLEALAVNVVGSEIIDSGIYADVTQTMQDAVDREAKSLQRALEKRLERLAMKHSGRK